MKISSDLTAVLAQCPGWGREAPPYALACLAAYVRANSPHKVRCLDLNNRMYHASPDKRMWDDKDLYSLWEDEPAVARLLESNRGLAATFVDEILATGAPVIGFTTHTTSFRFTLALARLIKAAAPEKIIILGGPQCSRSQAALRFAADPAIDAVVTGEGEEILLAVLDAAAAGKPLPRLPGMILNRGKKPPLDCGEGGAVKDLDALPFPDYSDFSADMAAGAYGSPGRLEILDSRGCPTRCHFCSEWQFWQNYRARGGAGLFEEIKHQTKKYPAARHFYFIGSLLNGKPKELELFCDRMIADGSKITWEGQAVVHPAMTPELARKMHKAGCRWLGLGLESGSKRLLKKMHKPFEPRTALANLRALSGAGIKLQANFMFGMPGETRADFDLTLKFLVAARPYLDSVLASQSFCVLDKNTALYNNAEAFGIENREHHLYWFSNRGRNNYPERLNRYEEFCRLALFLGLPETSGVLRVKPDKWLLLGDYYLNAGNEAEARKCFRLSLETEAFKETAALRLRELGEVLPPVKAADAKDALAAAREKNLKLNDEEFEARRTVLASTPRYVTIGAHRACNAACVFCQKDDLPLFSFKTYKDTIEPKTSPFLQQAEKVSFVGFGELLLMPGITEFLSHLNKTLPDTWKIITTNGTPLTSPVAERILEGLYSIQVSLHAANPRLHARLTGLKNFKTILANVELLAKERAARGRNGKLHLSLVSVLNTENASDMTDLVRLAARLGVQELRFEYMTLFRPEHLALSCFFQKERTNKEISRARLELEKLGAPGLFVKFPPLFGAPGRPELSPVCDDPWRHIYVEGQGTVLPCCYWGSHAGDILKQDILSVWNGKTYQELRRTMAAQSPMPDCSHCAKRAGFAVDDLLCHITTRPESRRAVLLELAAREHAASKKSGKGRAL
ncbi:MAG: hypothetical protein A2X35_10575 [Elusimicrobia bacterium GWA2_61_42]|nr:MAG: hypothetical protein A2X35_10575 [Elusimicrobia bacterium GWA2_61_42]OGR74705.1 MAG: hypothetical protein A2X38_02540 [Elusimicrobia bacterium GWC2_61_25]